MCKNISQFPAHAVNILTSSVVEATRANLKALAFQWACILVRPDYRSQIAEKYKKQIENIARRPVKGDPDENMSPCPFCKVILALYTLILTHNIISNPRNQFLNLSSNALDVKITFLSA